MGAKRVLSDRLAPARRPRLGASGRARVERGAHASVGVVVYSQLHTVSTTGHSQHGRNQTTSHPCQRLGWELMQPPRHGCGAYNDYTAGTTGHSQEEELN